MTDEESSREPGDPKIELPEEIQATADDLEASLSDPNRPKKDHFGTFNPAYRLLSAIRYSRVGKLIPDRIMKPIAYLMHVIIIHDTCKRMAAGERPYASDLDDFVVSPTEHVRMPALFIVELFPPSKIKKLERSLKKNNWNAAQLRVFPDLAPKLDEARSGSGWTWWPLGAVVRRGAPWLIPDATHGDLPSGFDSVELKALQIGEGITAVMARFDLGEAGATHLDAAWHRNFEPAINWGKFGGKWPQAQGKQWVAFRKVQETRGLIHKEARQWLADACPGVFASNKQPQPLIDVLVFNELDGSLKARPSRQVADAMRALGLPHPHNAQRSEQFPGMVLAPANIGLDSEMEDRRTWSLWGQRDSILEALSWYLKSLNLCPEDRSIIHYAREIIEDYFLRLSISELLTLYQLRYATLRDNARQSHRTFRQKYLKELRSNLLTLSLDLSSIARDVRKYNAQGWTNDAAQFVFEEAPFSAAQAKAEGFPVAEPINMNKQLLSRQTEMLDTLASADRDYRGILTSAASLTSSMQSLRSGRVALWVALVSLVVAATTLLISQAATHSQLDVILHWFATLV